MNIKEHIEAGHYPTDDKGRALVPMLSGRTFVVCATDKPGPCSLVGWIEGINHATGYHADSDDLLPPPPRKVKVTRWAIMSSNGPPPAWLVCTVDHRAERALARGEFFVELTGEYEEPWS